MVVDLKVRIYQSRRRSMQDTEEELSEGKKKSTFSLAKQERGHNLKAKRTLFFFLPGAKAPEFSTD